ncbi:MAG: zinc-ribbon domain-containing protein [Marinobacter sp.]|uniref:zinc-ribbon domain-containing protein n=1 Tax=Marinobacter sp. TaxID=50741 RepID=UPI00356223FF
MANTICSNCGTSIPPGSKKCPECGNLQTSRLKMILGAATVLVAALVIVIGAISVISRDDPANPAGDTTEIKP